MLLSGYDSQETYHEIDSRIQKERPHIWTTESCVVKPKKMDTARSWVPQSDLVDMSVGKQVCDLDMWLFDNKWLRSL